MAAEFKIKQVTKGFRRTVSDKDYGSVHVASEITADVTVATSEDLAEVNKKLARAARMMAMKDLDEFYALKEQGQVR